jgi:hypothetical protein
MKYILIVGAKENGKSTTIENVCKKLKPSKVWELDKEAQMFVEVALSTVIINGTYILEVNGSIILVVAGSPTEQEITITIIINIAISQGFNITIILAAMRSFERLEGYNTPEELSNFAQEIDRIKINKIEGDYMNNSEWQNRIERIVSKIKSNI